MATPEMPMPGGATQLRLIHIIEDNPSLYQLHQELPKLARELRFHQRCRKHGISVEKTADEIDRDEMNGWPMRKILHTMDRGVIKSIVSGTVAYDSGVDWFPQPEAWLECSGVYVIGLARQGKGGKFLTAKELGELVEGITQYLEGCRAMRLRAGAVLSTQQLEDKRWVEEVDEALDNPSRKSISPRFLSGQGDENIMEALVESLQLRIPKDATNVRQVQSPLYVGCSVNLHDRLANYEAKRWLRSVNKPMALTMSVLSAQGIPMELVPRVVLRSVREGELHLAERLVTTLAASLVSQTGFNAMQAGGQKGEGHDIVDGSKAQGQQMAIINRNIQDTAQELDNRAAFRVELKKLEQALGNLEPNIELLEGQMDELIARYPVEEMVRLRESMGDMKEQLDHKVEAWTELRDLSEIILKLTKLRYGVEDKTSDTDGRSSS